MNVSIDEEIISDILDDYVSIGTQEYDWACGKQMSAEYKAKQVSDQKRQLSFVELTNTANFCKQGWW